MFIPCRELFILQLAGLEVFSLDLLWVAAAQGAHGRQCFSALMRLEKTQKKLSRTFNDGNEQELVLCDVELKEPQLPGLLAGGDGGPQSRGQWEGSESNPCLGGSSVDAGDGGRWQRGSNHPWDEGFEAADAQVCPATSLQVWGTTFKAGDPKEHLWG